MGDETRLIRQQTGRTEAIYRDPDRKLRELLSYPGFMLSATAVTEAVALVRQAYEQRRGPFDADRQWFAQHKSELLKQYGEQFVAILESQVVDSDADFGELAQRVFKKYGCRDLLMPWVGEETETLEIPTPRITSS